MQWKSASDRDRPVSAEGECRDKDTTFNLSLPVCQSQSPSSVECSDLARSVFVASSR